MILAITTDKPAAELCLLRNESTIDTYTWQAHRELADTLLIKIRELLQKNQADLEDLQGIIVFSGEGSFTGLRIGTSVANTLAYSLAIKIAEGSGQDWIRNGLQNLKKAKLGEFVIPRYNAEPNITKPKIK